MTRRAPRDLDCPALIVLLFVSASFARGAEGELGELGVVTAQPLSAAQVVATGRAVPLYSARVGSRLSAHIAEWGKTEDGRFLDVGFAVKAGQELFRLDRTTFQDRERVAEAALKLAEAQRADLKAWERPERREALRATLAEIGARLAENRRDEDRFKRLVEVDKTMPVKRLEELQLQHQVLEAQRRAAQARLDEAEKGPTPTQLAVAEAQVNQAQAHLESALQDLKDTVIRAPYDGVITRRFRSPGDYAANAPFIEVLELTSVDLLEAELRLPEKFYPRVAPGAPVLLRSPLLGADLTLPVARLIPEVDPLQGTFAFRVRVPPEQRGKLTPGSFLQGVLELGGDGEGAVLPQRAVLIQEGQAAVFVVEGNRMKRRAVELGDRLTEGVIVRRGLKPGERVVLGPSAALKDGQELPANLKE
jgi:multidrug efflux pump subunit AcrA (membrane-fusion protein)